MRDRPDSSSFDEDAELDYSRHFLRRTLTWRFRDPEDAAALNRVVSVIFDALLESGQYGRDEDASLYFMEFKAAAEDLGLVAEFFGIRAMERFQCSLDPEEARLCERAERWGEQLKGIADGILSDLA